MRAERSNLPRQRSVRLRTVGPPSLDRESEGGGLLCPKALSIPRPPTRNFPSPPFSRRPHGPETSATGDKLPVAGDGSARYTSLSY